MLLGSQISTYAQSYESQLGAITTALKANPNDPKAAQDLVKAYLKTYKKDPEALVALGNSYLTIKNYAKAIEYADMAIKRNKNFGDAYVLKGDVEALKDDGGQAAAWYQQAMTMDPKNPHGYTSYANVYRKRDPKLVQETMNQLKLQVPDYPVEAETAHAFFTAGNLTRAYENFTKADVNKLENRMLYEYAQTAYYLDKKEEALELAKKGMQKFAGNTYESYFTRYALYSAVDAKKMDEAANYSQKLQNSDQELNTLDYMYIGQVLASQNQYEEAIAKYEKSLSMDDKTVRNYQYLSEAYNALGNEDKALEFSEKYLNVDNNAKPSDFVKLANIYLGKSDKEDKEGNFQKAMGIYDKLIAKYPTTSSWSHLQQANAGLSKDFLDYAESKYRQVIEELENKEGRDANETGYLKEAYRLLGIHLWSNKDNYDAAKPFFEKLLQLDPENSAAKQALGIQ